MESLTPLRPDKHITEDDFSGVLKVDGNLKNNCIRFRFLFDEPEMVHPLIITLELSPKLSYENNYKRNSNQDNSPSEKILDDFECEYRDINNPIIKTDIEFPQYLLKEYHIMVVAVKSKISCNLC